ncbi:MAG: acetylhydrolase [Paucibacter sp.]|nr:acetylhydrolase [Roseateles sp.]
MKNLRLPLFLRGALALSLLMGLGACRTPDAAVLSADPLPVLDAPPAVEATAAALFSTEDMDWQDAARQRAVPTRLYWPADAEAKGRAGVPLIVFSHGIGGSRRGYSYLGAYWASRGYASLHVQHVGSDRNVWLGNPFGLVGRLQDAAKESEALHRVADMRFALDQVLLGARGEQIDQTRLIAAGHSYGANTVMLLSGAQVLRQGVVMDQLRDPRIKAAIIISAPPFYGETERTAEILKPITIPTLHITSTEDVIVIPGYHSGAADRIAVFDATGSATKSLVVFEGGSHSMFTDRAGTGGVALNPRVKTATKEVALAFLSQVFDGHNEALQQWGERHQAIINQWQPASPADAAMPALLHQPLTVLRSSGSQVATGMGLSSSRSQIPQASVTEQ